MLIPSSFLVLLNITSDFLSLNEILDVEKT